MFEKRSGTVDVVIRNWEGNVETESAFVDEIGNVVGVKLLSDVLVNLALDFQFGKFAGIVCTGDLVFDARDEWGEEGREERVVGETSIGVSEGEGKGWGEPMSRG